METEQMYSMIENCKVIEVVVGLQGMLATINKEQRI